MLALSFMQSSGRRWASRMRHLASLTAVACVRVQLYDLVAGTQGLTWSRYVTPGEARRQFPTLSPTHDDGQSLKGTVRGCSSPLETSARWLRAKSLEPVMFASLPGNHEESRKEARSLFLPGPAWYVARDAYMAPT